MLVLLGQRILPRRTQQGVQLIVFVFTDHLFAAAGVAGQGEAAQQRFLGKNALFHQRCHQRHKAAGMAAGIGNAAGMGDPLPLLTEKWKKVR